MLSLLVCKRRNNYLNQVSIQMALNKEDQNLTIVYHCYCVNKWEEVVRDQLPHFEGHSIYCSLIGDERQERILQDIAGNCGADLTIQRVEDASYYEHLAMEWVAQLARERPNGLTMYFHTKGTSSNNWKGRSWRNYLSHVFLKKWQELHKNLVVSSKEATGSWYCHYPMDPDMNGQATNFFAGNFWIAKNSYINTLPNYGELKEEFSSSRYLPERFIGLGNPSVLFVDQMAVFSVKGKGGVYGKIRRLKWFGWQFDAIAKLYAYLAKKLA